MRVSLSLAEVYIQNPSQKFKSTKEKKVSKIYDDDLDEDLDYNDYDDYDDGYKDSYRSQNYDENDYSYDDEDEEDSYDME